MALARALAIEPRVLLLDEPFGALDASVRAELRAWLRRLHERGPVTTILVTHDQEEAMDVADRIIVHQRGPHPAGRRAARAVRPARQRLVLRFLGETARAGGRTVRPHDVDVALEALDGGTEAMVTRVVHLGFEVRIELMTAEGEESRALLTRHAAEALELASGDVVFVRPHPTPQEVLT